MLKDRSTYPLIFGSTITIVVAQEVASLKESWELSRPLINFLVDSHAKFCVQIDEMVKLEKERTERK